jgi:hypothetical protein
VARRNVVRVVERMREQSRTLTVLLGRTDCDQGAMYDIVTGKIEFLTENGMNHVALGTGLTIRVWKLDGRVWGIWMGHDKT